MFIRQVKKQRSKSSKVFYQYTLAQTSRINGEVKQSSILYLGSNPLLEDKNNRKRVLEMLKSLIFQQPELFPANAPARLSKLADEYYEKYKIKYPDPNTNHTSIPTDSENSDYQSIDINGMDVENARAFGAEHLCKQTLDNIGLADFLTTLGADTMQVKRAMIAIAAKAIYASSEHKTSQILDINSELASCYGYTKKISHKHLYSTADYLYQHKEKIDSFLYQKFVSMFNLEDSLVIYDISNTYFETAKRNSKLAKYANSKEKRNDCPVVVFTGVINKQGFIRHSKVYEGNKSDSATLADMITHLEQHSPKTQERKTVVIDAGIATEDNLKMLDEKNYNYVCVSRKRLKDYQVKEGKNIRMKTTSGDPVELQIFSPKGFDDTWMYIQSEGKRKKETSMEVKLSQRFEEELSSIRSSLFKKGGTKKIDKVWERIGRAKQKHNRISAAYQIEVQQHNKVATEITWTRKKIKVKEDKTQGVYFIRTNMKTTGETQLWNIYNTIREVESTFRSLKSDLNIRPVFHQNDSRVESHIYLTILAYQLVNTIRHILKEKGINHDWKNIARIMHTHKIQTIKLPTKTKTIYIRKPSKPIQQVQEIYTATNCHDTQKITKKYVVYH